MNWAISMLYLSLGQQILNNDQLTSGYFAMTTAMTQLMTTCALTVMLIYATSVKAEQELPFTIEPITSFDEPWAMTFLPDGQMLVTEKKGRLLVVDTQGNKRNVNGLPDVGYGGQGGLGDVALHPNFATNGLVYLSYVETGNDGTRGAAVGRGRISLEGRRPTLTGFEVIWRQYPKVYSGRSRRWLVGA
jgi:aldose sugar dehydrogenase